MVASVGRVSTHGPPFFPIKAQHANSSLPPITAWRSLPTPCAPVAKPRPHGRPVLRPDNGGRRQDPPAWDPPPSRHPACGSASIIPPTKKKPHAHSRLQAWRAPPAPTSPPARVSTQERSQPRDGISREGAVTVPVHNKGRGGRKGKLASHRKHQSGWETTPNLQPIISGAPQTHGSRSIWTIMSPDDIRHRSTVTGNCMHRAFVGLLCSFPHPFARVLLVVEGGREYDELVTYIGSHC